MGNVFIAVKYMWDWSSLRCEPCPPKVECPPCETGFMANIIWIYLGWNLVGFLLQGFGKKEEE